MSAPGHFPSNSLRRVPLKIMSNLLLPTCVPIDVNVGVSKQAVQPLVMVVDDHADTRDMLRFAIEARGCRVVEASDGEQAVRLAENMLPDLILMDTGLQAVDGYMATERIRKLESHHRMAVIFLSGYAQPEARDKALAAGGDDYLIKPVNLEELDQALGKYLMMTGSHRC